MDDPQYVSMAQEEAINQFKNDLALTAKAKELGLDQLTDEELEAVKTSAQEELTYYQDYAKLLNQSALEGKTDEEAAQFVNELIEANGINLDALTEAATKNAIDKKLKDYAVKDITVTDEEIQADYDSKVEANKTTYSENRTCAFSPRKLSLFAEVNTSLKAGKTSNFFLSVLSFASRKAVILLTVTVVSILICSR